MAMTITLNQFGNLGLTAGQKAGIQAFADIGNARRDAMRPTSGGTLTPDISGVTLKQAKTLIDFCRAINTLLGPAMEGGKYVREKLMDDAANTVDAAATADPTL